MERGDKRQSVKDKYKKLPLPYRQVLVISDDASKLTYIPNKRQRIGQESVSNKLDGIHARINQYGIEESYNIFITYLV